MIAVVDYHKGNLKSVERGLIGAGADARITDDPAEIERASAIVLPGVGAFADASAELFQLGQMDVIRKRVAQGVPFLGICLGLQLMFSEGEEHAERAEDGSFSWLPEGLGFIEGRAHRLPSVDGLGATYKIPHVGWNSIQYAGEQAYPLFEGIPDGEFFYFTHSYVAPESAATIATTTHSTTFPSAVLFGEVAYGVQFHPEKSSDAGAALLRNFVRICERA